MHIQTPYNKIQRPGDYEIPNPLSLTIPDQSMSLQTILEQYARGLPFTVGKIPMYDTEDPRADFTNLSVIPDFKRMDLSEKFDYIKAQQELLDNYNEQQLQARTKAERDAIKAELIEELRLQELEQGERNQTKPTDPPDA